MIISDTTTTVVHLYIYPTVHVLELIVLFCDSISGSSTQQVHRQLCAMVSDTSLGEILMSIEDGGQCEELYRRYIHDFVRSVHKCTHKKAETLKHEYKVQDLVVSNGICGEC